MGIKLDDPRTSDAWLWTIVGRWTNWWRTGPNKKCPGVYWAIDSYSPFIHEILPEHGKIWKNMGKYGKIWKNMETYGKIWKNEVLNLIWPLDFEAFHGFPIKKSENSNWFSARMVPSRSLRRAVGIRLRRSSLVALPPGFLKRPRNISERHGKSTWRLMLTLNSIDDRGNLHDLKHKGTLWYLMKVGLHANVFE